MLTRILQIRTMGLRKGQVQGRCEVKELTLSLRSNKSCLRLSRQTGGFGGFILFNGHFSMVGGHERA
jgi:hypothetical protein